MVLSPHSSLDRTALMQICAHFDIVDAVCDIAGSLHVGICPLPVVSGRDRSCRAEWPRELCQAGALNRGWSGIESPGPLNALLL